MKTIVLIKLKTSDNPRPFWDGLIYDEPITSAEAAERARKHYENVENVLSVKVKYIEEYLNPDIIEEMCKAEKEDSLTTALVDIAQELERVVQAILEVNSDNRMSFKNAFMWLFAGITILQTISWLMFLLLK